MPFITARVVAVIRPDTAALGFVSAGEDQSVLCATLVQLEAVIIGDITQHTFEWEQTFGTPVTLINPNTLTPSFVNPQTSEIIFTFYTDRYTPFEQSDEVLISRRPTDIFRNSLGTGVDPDVGGIGSPTTSNVVMPQFRDLNVHLTNDTYNYPAADYSPIYTTTDLNKVREDLQGSYWLMNDIDLSGYANWDPIGTPEKPFRGELQGNGYLIDNLTITSATKDAGLFSILGDGTLIEKVGIINANISGVADSIYKAILAGSTSGIVTVRDSYTKGTVASGDDLAGGFIGDTGSNASSTYENTYADVTVTGIGTDVGAWAGTFNATPTYIENYGNTTKTASVVGTGSPGSTEVEGRTTDQLRTQSSYFGYDFVNDWYLPVPRFDNVVLQLELEGADSDTTTTDISNIDSAIAFAGSSAIDDSQFKIGSTSVLLGAGNLRLPSSQNIAAISQWSTADDMTMEMWTRFNGDPGGAADKAFLSTYHTPNNDSFLWRHYNGDMNFILGDGAGGGVGDSVAWDPDGDTWYHIAVCLKRGATDIMYFWVDGESIGTSTAFDGLTNVNGNTYFGVEIGSYWNQNAGTRHGGWMDSIRMVHGEALYTEPFTPPTNPHSVFEDASIESAELQEQTPSIDTIKTGGGCDNYMITWERPDVRKVQGTMDLRYTFAGSFLETRSGTNWIDKMFVSADQNHISVAAGQYRLTTIWRHEGTGLVTRDVEVIHTAGLTAPPNRPGGADAMRSVVGSANSNNLVITIFNPVKISKSDSDTFARSIGDATSSEIITLFKVVGVVKDLGTDTQKRSIGDVTAFGDLVIFRVNGASIG